MKEINRQALTASNLVPFNSLPKMNHKVQELILLTRVLSTLLLTNSSPVALKLVRVVGHGAEQISQEILCMCGRGQRAMTVVSL